MRRLLVCFITISIVLYACKDQKKEYIENVKPIITALEQIGMEVDGTVNAIKGDGMSISEFETKIQDIENRLKKEKENFIHFIAPMELDEFQKKIQEAIAGEELAISSIKSYAARKNMLKLAEKQILELEKEEQQLTTSGKKLDKDENAKNRLSRISTEKANLQKQKDNLIGEMEAQMKFFSTSHEYFTKMLKAMKGRLK